MKRAFDVVIGTVFALLAIPLIVLGALGVALTLRCWPFFVQDRVGRDGRTFRFFKLRTLPAHAPRYADKYALLALDLPPFTRFLRRSHLDELPQLLLVPFGKMSLVGPRPEMPVLHRHLPIGFADARTLARPGCTGLWQIGRDSHRLIGEAPEYDLFYLQHQSWRLDLWVLLRTARLLVSNGRYVSLRDVPAWARAPREPEQLRLIDAALTDAA